MAGAAGRLAGDNIADVGHIVPSHQTLVDVLDHVAADDADILMEIALAVLKLLPELVHGLVVDDLAAGEHEVLRDAHLGRQGEQNAGLEPLVVDKGLGGAGGHDGDDVGILDGFTDFLDFQTGIGGLVPGSTVFAQANRNVNARIMQVQCMCVTLRAVADDGNGLACELLQIAILLIKNSCHDKLPLSVHELVC